MIEFTYILLALNIEDSVTKSQYLRYETDTVADIMQPCGTSLLLEMTS